MTVVGDSMAREVFYGIAGSLSSRPQKTNEKDGMKWIISNDTKTKYSSLSQSVHIDLYRPNFAMVAAHSFDSIYHKRVIEHEYDTSHMVRRTSERAIEGICNDARQDWMPCPLSMNMANSVMYIANAAGWEPRAFLGVYGFDWDMVYR